MVKARYFPGLSSLIEVGEAPCMLRYIAFADELSAWFRQGVRVGDTHHGLRRRL